VEYVFQHLDIDGPETSSSDLAISEAMGTYRTNSAGYDHPDGGGVPEWLVINDANPVVSQRR
jgi:para-nitrobenzyl esterase